MSAILNWMDYSAIIVYLLLSLWIGVKYASRAGESLGEFFLSGRQLTWYVAGFSMVATTFAADTPLTVAELVAKNGIAGNWLWWNFLIGGTLTTFFFAKLWRRAEIMTDNEFIELRYGGKPAAFLRGFKSLYLGLFMNSVIIGWVNLALVKIFCVFLDIPASEAIWYVAGAMLLTAVYSAISGLWGVAITDLVQFVIAMTGCIILAIVVVNSEKVGGIQGIKDKLPPQSLEFFPKIGNSSSGGNILALSWSAFIGFIAVQWWSSWYPGAEPGGGGYIAQRMMSAKDEKSALKATLFFQVAHYCLRPWPWILTGLCVIILFPELHNDPGRGFVMAIKDYLPNGLKGLLLVAFLAAYMSTISTQLNWGSSYFINDFYKRFISTDQTEKHYVMISRIFGMIAMVIALAITTQITKISDVWLFVVNSGAGLGLVLILRWYWWRINVWSEITATIVPFLAYGYCIYGMHLDPDDSSILFITVGTTTISWIIITFLTKPEADTKLISFYNRVQPQGFWKPISAKVGDAGYNKDIRFQFLSWGSAVVMTYSILFLIGKIIFMDYQQAIFYGCTALIGLIGVNYGMRKS